MGVREEDLRLWILDGIGVVRRGEKRFKWKKSRVVNNLHIVLEFMRRTRSAGGEALAK